jgi:hypothetical protein
MYGEEIYLVISEVSGRRTHLRPLSSVTPMKLERNSLKEYRLYA